jgi:cell division protein FtsB
MRILSFVLIGLIVLLQYPLWVGKGGWMKVWDMDRQVQVQKAKNDILQSRNSGLEAEAADLKQGMGAVEERARYELGLVKPDEVFFQIVPPQKAAAATQR